MICSGWPFTTLANPPRFGGQGQPYWRAYGWWKGEGENEDGETFLPFLHLFYAHWQTRYSGFRILYVHQWTSSWWVFRPPQLVEMVACWVTRPIGCPCLPMHYWSAWSWEPVITTSTLKQPQRKKRLPTPLTHFCSVVQCPLFTNSTVDLTADNSASTVINWFVDPYSGSGYSVLACNCFLDINISLP